METVFARVFTTLSDFRDEIRQDFRRDLHREVDGLRQELRRELGQELRELGQELRRELGQELRRELRREVGSLRSVVDRLDADMSRVLQKTCSVLDPEMKEYFRRLQQIDFRDDTAPSDFEVQIISEVDKVTGKVINKVTGFRSPTDFSWLYMEDARVIILRQVMLDACDAVEQMRQTGHKVAVVTGSPGTGKTALTSILASDFLRNNDVHEIILHNASEPAAWHIKKRRLPVGGSEGEQAGLTSAGSDSKTSDRLSAADAARQANVAPVCEADTEFDVFHIPRDQVLSELQTITKRYTTEQQNSVIYLFDAATATGQPERTSAFTVVTASPAENHFLDVKKRAGCTKPFYLPLWTLKSLQAAADLTASLLGTTRIPVEANFKKFNGIYRHCMRGDPSVWEAQQVEAVSRLTWLSMAMMNPHSFSIGWPHRLVVLNSTPPYTSYRLECVSNSLYQDLAAHLLRVSRHHFWNLFQGVDDSLNVILGQIWEGYVLSELSGGPTHQVGRAISDDAEHSEVSSLADEIVDMELRSADSEDPADEANDPWDTSSNLGDTASPSEVDSEEVQSVNTKCWARGLLARRRASSRAFAVNLSVSAQQCVTNKGVCVDGEVEPRHGLLLVPESNNFPACDAILYQEADGKHFIYLLQMTISADHPIRASALESVYKMLSDWSASSRECASCWHPAEAQVRLVFVVPSDKWNRFKRRQPINDHVGHVMTHPDPNPKQLALTLQSATSLPVKSAAPSSATTPSRPRPRTTRVPTPVTTDDVV